MLTDYLIEAMSRTIERIWQGMSIIEDLNWLIKNQIDKEKNKYHKWTESEKSDKEIMEGVREKYYAKIKNLNKMLSELDENLSIIKRIIDNYNKHLNSVKQTDDIKRMFSYLKTNLAHDSMYRVNDISQLSSITISKPASYEEDLLNHVITMYINGYKSKINYRTRYVVIDEAQDLNPMIYWMLRKYMPNANIAAYGDMAQSIFRDVDGNMWDEFAVAAEFPSAKPLYLQTTYRSTKSVMALAERVLSKFPLPDYKYANAVMDSGIAPTIIQLTSHEKVMQYVLALKVANPQFTYAVIFKKRETVEQFHDLCEKHNTQDMFLSVDNYQKDQSHSRITITYISKVKGLEFDVVIVADADDAEYPADSYHSRLLYVAISRAAKDLHIVYQHQLSELLR
jgi:DNA helicase-2/ATP-dependent DNA helicase PcrA